MIHSSFYKNVLFSGLDYAFLFFTISDFPSCYSISINADVTRPGKVSVSIKEHRSPNVVYHAALGRLVWPALS